MSMHGRNDRSIHGDHNRIARNLARHHTLMIEFEAAGLGRTAASKLAMDVIRHLISETEARTRAGEKL